MSDHFCVDGKVCIITGSCGILGSNYAKMFAKLKTKLCLTDIVLDNLNNLRNKILLEFPEAEIIVCKHDVSNQYDWEIVRDLCLDKFGKIDILLNNAGYTGNFNKSQMLVSFFDMDIDIWKNVLDVNLSGTFLGCKIIGKYMTDQKNGKIINVSSIYGINGPKHFIYDKSNMGCPASYVVSKFGVIGLTKYCGTLFIKDNVNVNCITPAGIENNQNENFIKNYTNNMPIGRMATPQDMNGAILYLASDASKYCVGTNLIVDGGWSSW